MRHTCLRLQRIVDEMLALRLRWPRGISGGWMGLGSLYDYEREECVNNTENLMIAYEPVEYHPGINLYDTDQIIYTSRSTVY